MNIVQSLQYAITPCVLISSNSLLLLSFTNRFSRLSSRIRHTDTTSERVFLYQRLRRLRNVILSNVLSILFQILLIIAIFISILINKFNDSKYLLILIFLLSCFFIILSIILFLIDVFHSTHLIYLFITNRNNISTLI